MTIPNGHLYYRRLGSFGWQELILIDKNFMLMNTDIASHYPLTLLNESATGSIRNLRLSKRFPYFPLLTQFKFSHLPKLNQFHQPSNLYHPILRLS